MDDVDLLVLGGGCAGLSLALRLSEGAGGLEDIVVLEARESYQDDRTWSFWRTRPHRFEEIVAHEWAGFEVLAGGEVARLDCQATPYQMIPAGAFYAHALELISRSPHVDVELGARVEGVPERVGDHWVVRAGERQLRARHLVDTRPPRVRPSCLLWQSFFGQVVRTEVDRFDPEVATLMDFAGGHEDRIQFTYVLPRSRREALVETTVFGREAIGPGDLEQAHGEDLERRLAGSGHEVVRQEHGVLPMGLTSSLHPVAWTRAGLFHGGARPSTGYAFQRIQRWADSCAASLRTGLGATGLSADPSHMRWMDSIFLGVLADRPASGPGLLLQLFSRAPTERVIRFLSDEGSVRDSLSIVSSLPPWPFLRQAAAQLSGRSRRAIG